MTAEKRREDLMGRVQSALGRPEQTWIPSIGGAQEIGVVVPHFLLKDVRAFGEWSRLDIERLNAVIELYTKAVDRWQNEAIEAKDEVIALQAQQALSAGDREDALPVGRTVSENLIDIVEGIGGIQHGTWRDEKGMRLKDTPAWVAFYVAARNNSRPAPDALRVALEALECSADVLEIAAGQIDGASAALVETRQALAALQSEQKGGA